MAGSPNIRKQRFVVRRSTGKLAKTIVHVGPNIQMMPHRRRHQTVHRCGHFATPTGADEQWCRREEFHLPPQPQTGRASFQASGFPDCLDFENVSALGRVLPQSIAAGAIPMLLRLLPQSSLDHYLVVKYMIPLARLAQHGVTVKRSLIYRKRSVCNHITLLPSAAVPTLYRPLVKLIKQFVGRRKRLTWLRFRAKKAFECV